MQKSQLMFFLQDFTQSNFDIDTKLIYAILTAYCDILSLGLKFAGNWNLNTGEFGTYIGHAEGYDAAVLHTSGGAIK